MWFSSLDVTDALLSVGLCLPIHSKFVLSWMGQNFLGFHSSFGLTTALCFCSWLRRLIKKFLGLHDFHASSLLDDSLYGFIGDSLVFLHSTWSSDLLEGFNFKFNERSQWELLAKPSFAKKCYESSGTGLWVFSRSCFSFISQWIEWYNRVLRLDVTRGWGCC